MNGFHDYHRGEIYYADLNLVFGHEQGGIRPVLILQNDVGNYFSPTIIVTAATRRCCKKPTQPTHVVLTDVEGLAPSLFLLEQIRTVNKHRMREYVGRLTDEQMGRIESTLKKALVCVRKIFFPMKWRRHNEQKKSDGSLSPLPSGFAEYGRTLYPAGRLFTGFKRHLYILSIQKRL